MKRSTRLSALLLALVFALSLLAACSGGGTTPPAATTPPVADTTPGTDAATPDAPAPGTVMSDKTLKIAVSQDSGTLDALGVSGGFNSVQYSYYETLWDTRVDGTRKWVLAESYERISDIQYTLKIREGIKFSNGNPLTAEDVLFSMERSATDPQYALNVKVIDFEKTKVTGDYTMDVWYTEYNASQEPGICMLFIQDKESFDQEALARNPIGTGPYVVSEYIVNSHLRVTARDDYWGEGPYIKNIEFRVINEPSQVINALETHDVDMAIVQLSDVSYVESLGYKITTSSAGYSDTVLYSLLPGTPLESKEARYAVSMAIDREAIADIVYQGLSSVPSQPTSKYFVDYEPRFDNLNETYAVGYNPERAKELATQAGLVGKTLRLITNGAASATTVAEMIQENLLDIGVNVQINNYDQATYFGTMMDASNFEMALFTPSAPSWMNADVLAMYLTFIPLGWSGPDRDAYGVVSQGAITTYDENERADKLFDTVKMFVEFTPWYSLCESVMSRAQAPNITGVEYMLAGSIYYDGIAFTD